MKRSTVIILFFILIGIAVVASLKQFKIHKQPNIVFILTCDQGYGDVGFNGNKVISTKNIDSLAKKSVVFNRFYVSPVGYATQASILTGKYQVYHDVFANFQQNIAINSANLTLTRVLKRNHYHTAFFGEKYPVVQPDTLEIKADFSCFYKYNDKLFKNCFDERGIFLKTASIINADLPTIVTDSLIEFVSHKKEPFFAFITFNRNSITGQSNHKYAVEYKAKGLDANTTNVYSWYQIIDDNVLRIVNELKKSGLTKNTIIVFTSSNGPDFIRFNANLKGRKGQVDEGGVRVPFLIHCGNNQFKNRIINDGFVAHIDLMPTLLELCNIKYEPLEFDGISFSKVLFNENVRLTDRYFFSHQFMGTYNTEIAIRNSMLALVFNKSDTALYNLETDPCQRQNIYKEYPDITRQFFEDYYSWFNGYKKKDDKVSLAYVNEN